VTVSLGTGLVANGDPHCCKKIAAVFEEASNGFQIQPIVFFGRWQGFVMRLEHFDLIGQKDFQYAIYPVLNIRSTSTL